MWYKDVNDLADSLGDKYQNVIFLDFAKAFDKVPNLKWLQKAHGHEVLWFNIVNSFSHHRRSQKNELFDFDSATPDRGPF